MAKIVSQSVVDFTSNHFNTMDACFAFCFNECWANLLPRVTLNLYQFPLEFCIDSNGSFEVACSSFVLGQDNFVRFSFKFLIKRNCFGFVRNYWRCLSGKTVAQSSQFIRFLLLLQFFLKLLSTNLFSWETCAHVPKNSNMQTVVLLPLVLNPTSTIQLNPDGPRPLYLLIQGDLWVLSKFLPCFNPCFKLTMLHLKLNFKHPKLQ